MSEKKAETKTETETQTNDQKAEQDFIRRHAKTIQLSAALISLVAWAGYSLLATGSVGSWWDLLGASLLGYGLTQILCGPYFRLLNILYYALTGAILFAVLGLLLPSFRLALIVIFFCVLASGIYHAYATACRIKSLPTADYHQRQSHKLLPTLSVSVLLLGVIQGLTADGPATAFLYALYSLAVLIVVGVLIHVIALKMLVTKEQLEHYAKQCPSGTRAPHK